MTIKQLHPVGRWLRRRADDVEVALMATMFVCFLLQIIFRYFLNRPLGWTEEVTVLCWLWGVLWGAAFVLSDHEEIRFDIVYGAVSSKLKRAFTVVSGIAWILLLAVSLPGSWAYVKFMKREHTAYLHMRFDFLYAIYVIFAVACMVKAALLVWHAWRGTPSAAAEADVQKADWT